MDKKDQKLYITGLMFEAAIEREIERRGKPEYLHDTELQTSMLQEINALGYNYEYVEQLTWTPNHKKDVVNIVCRYFGKYDHDAYNSELLHIIAKRKYPENAVKVIEYFNSKNFEKHIYNAYDNAFMRFNDLRYVSEYIKWLKNPMLGNKLPLTMKILKKQKNLEARIEYIKHLSKCDEYINKGYTELMYTCISGLEDFKDEESISAVKQMTLCNDLKISKFALQTLKKMNT